MPTTLIYYTLQLADNALIHGHRMSEWCGHGPVLEQDIALSNIALDHIGQARSFYQYAASLCNALPDAEKQKLFSSPALHQKTAAGAAFNEDDLAYLRDGWDFRNLLLVEQPNNDWAYTSAKCFFLDVFNQLYFSALRESNDVTLAAIAEKSLKEVNYHLRWSSEWVIRLGDGSEESKRRMQEAIDDLWMFTGELLDQTEVETALGTKNIAPGPDQFSQQWKDKVAATFEEATLTVPKADWMQEGGKSGRHTEHLGYILAEMQHMQRAYPGMEW